jgi:hypothetical protein
VKVEALAGALRGVGKDGGKEEGKRRTVVVVVHSGELVVLRVSVG